MNVEVDGLGGFRVLEMRVPFSFGMNVTEEHEAQAHAQKEEQNVRNDALSRALRAHHFGEETAKRDEEKGRGRSGEHVRQVGRVRQKEAARGPARKRRRHREEKDRDRAAPGPAKRPNERHGARLLRNFVEQHRRRGEPSERTAHLESPRHDNPVDEAVK